MRIAIVIERANIALGGAERSVFELAAALQNSGREVHILAGKGRTKQANIHILCPRGAGTRTSHFRLAKALKNHLAEHHYDIVHSVLPFDCVDLYQPRGGSYAESILRNAASYHNTYLSAYKRLTAFANSRRTVRLLAERRLCKRTGGPMVAALSNYVARQFREHYGLDDGRITVIPNGVKTDKPVDTERAEKLREQILEKLALQDSDRPVFFLFVANNFRLKGLAPLIHAFSQAAAQNKDRPAYLVVAGSDRTQKHRRLARHLGIEKKIIFLGPVRNIQNVLSITDVAVLPTFYDPSSRFTLEALAAGRPVITTRFNGAADLFVNNRHGIVIDGPEDVTALARALLHFTDQANIRSASEAIRHDNLKAKISIDRVAEQMLSLYTSIAKGGK